MRKIVLDDFEFYDLFLLRNKSFRPIISFMDQEDYISTCDRGIVTINGVDHVSPMPIILRYKEGKPEIGETYELLDKFNNVLATLTVNEIFKFDWRYYATRILGTESALHPMVAEVKRWEGQWCVSGGLCFTRGSRLEVPFQDLCHSPEYVRDFFKGIPRVIAFQTRNPLHRVHEEITKKAVDDYDASLLLHPVTGVTKPGDVPAGVRVKAYKALMDNYYHSRHLLSLLPLAMRMAGPREAVWHAMIRKNYGATHFIVGRDHAGCGDFYGPYDAQEAVQKAQDSLGITMVPFEMMVYQKATKTYVPVSKAEGETLEISGTQARELLKTKSLPDWFTRPEVAEILYSYGEKSKTGLCVWFTGLSASGKTTQAQRLKQTLEDEGHTVTLLDGDVIRQHLSRGLGFSKEDRDTNVLRIGYVASEIVKHGGIVICSCISPFEEIRNQVRGMFQEGDFMQVYVDTSLEVCIKRDPKGMYAKAILGEITEFTGISSPYEVPTFSEVWLRDASLNSDIENLHKMVRYKLDV